MLNHRGFSLLETLVVLVIVGVLATLAYPGFAQVLARSRRGDAITRLLEVQQAQERWRADHPAYGSLDDLALPAVVAGSAYRIAIADHDAAGYTVAAEAIGPQASDMPCRVMRLSLQAGHAEQASGPDHTAANDAVANRRCWQG